MKNLYLFISFFLLCTFTLNSQTVQLTGRVVDASNNEPIVGASVFVPNQKKGGVTDSEGNFRIDLVAQQNLELQFSFLGYESLKLQVDALNKESVALKTIILTPQPIGLEEILVQANAQTSTTKIDRQSYRVKDFKTADTGSAVDLLSKLPSVSLLSDGTVTVRGNTDFVVYLDGKPTQMEASVLLGQLSSSQIENIELISVPGSRFDAQGKGGIVNILTKKKGQKGLNVNTVGSVGGTPWYNFKDPLSGFYQNDNRSNAGLNLQYFDEKFSLFGGVNFNSRNVNGDRTGDARILIEDGLYKHMVASGERPEWYKNATANFGADFQLSPKSTLSGTYFYGKREEGRSAFYVYNNFYADLNKNTVFGKDRNEEYVYNPNTDNRLGVFHTASLDYVYLLRESSDLKVNFLYEFSDLQRALQNGNYQFDNTTKEIGLQTLGYKQFDRTPLNAYRFSVDYTTQLANGSKLSSGFQPQFVNINGAFRYDTLSVLSGQAYFPYSDLENSINLYRNVYAAYIDYGGTYSKLDYLLGLRLEYSEQLVDGFNDNYFSLYNVDKKNSYRSNRFDPFYSVHLSWKATPKEKILFSSSRRVNRPALKNMAPFLYRRHLEVYEVGDPTLQPEYSWNSELTYNRKIEKHDVSLTCFYKAVENAVFRVNTVTNEIPAVYAIVKEDVLIRSYTNAGNSESYGFELNSNLDFGEFAKLFLGGVIYNYHVKGDIFGYKVDNSSLNWSVKSNLLLNLLTNLKLNIDFNVKSGTVTAQGKNDLLYLGNASLNYSPKKLKGWEFGLKLYDFLGSNIEGLDTQAFNASGNEIFYQTTDYFRTGYIGELSVKYFFNKITKKDKKIESVFGKEQF